MNSGRSLPRLVVIVCFATFGLISDRVLRSPTLAATPLAATGGDGEALAREVCASCHAFPRPDVLPRAAWRGDIEKMAYLMADKDLPETGAKPEPLTLSSQLQKILGYYEARAPIAFPTPEPWPSPDDRVRFARRSLGFAE